MCVRSSFSQRWASILFLLPVVVLAVSGGAFAQGTGYWHTSGSQIIDSSGRVVRIAGINWYGFETKDQVVHGLWARDYHTILNTIKNNGYNAIRLPYSNQLVESPIIPSNISYSNSSGAINTDLKGLNALQVMDKVIGAAGALGLHVILDNHRSAAGNSAEANGLWYTAAYPESAWIRDWTSVQAWANGLQQTLGAADTVFVTPFAADGWPTVVGFDLRNEPHTASSYMGAATWGTGDGIDPAVNPNPNPFAPACVAASTCHDWRLAAERAADAPAADAATNTWPSRLTFVEGISQYPSAGGSAASGPYDYTWWG